MTPNHVSEHVTVSAGRNMMMNAKSPVTHIAHDERVVDLAKLTLSGAGAFCRYSLLRPLVCLLLMPRSANINNGCDL